MTKKPEPEDPAGHGHNIFQDRTDRFELDQILRQYGFKIYGRPEGAYALWSWSGDGKVYPQPAAVSMTGDRQAIALQEQLDLRRKRLDEQRKQAG